MEYNYTIKDIATKTGKTIQSIQKLRNKNTQVLNENTQTRGRFIYFNETALQWFLNYYGIKTTTEEAKNDEKQATEEAQDTNKDETIASFEEQINDLKTRLAEAEDRRSKAEAEAQQAREQLGMALDALRQAQQMNTLLLPPPRRTMGQKIKNFFSKEKGTV